MIRYRNKYYIEVPEVKSNSCDHCSFADEEICFADIERSKMGNETDVDKLMEVSCSIRNIIFKPLPIVSILKQL